MKDTDHVCTYQAASYPVSHDRIEDERLPPNPIWFVKEYLVDYSALEGLGVDAALATAHHRKSLNLFHDLSKLETDPEAKNLQDALAMLIVRASDIPEAVGEAIRGSSYTTDTIESDNLPAYLLLAYEIDAGRRFRHPGRRQFNDAEILANVPLFLKRIGISARTSKSGSGSEVVRRFQF